MARWIGFIFLFSLSDHRCGAGHILGWRTDLSQTSRSAFRKWTEENSATVRQ
jgi:hypothetical protein